MDLKEAILEAIIIIVTAIILGLSFSFPTLILFFIPAILILILLAFNILAKSITAYYFESSIKTSFWKWYYFGFRRDSHFKKPVPMLWLPILLSLISLGAIFWMPILEFDVKAKPERASRRHGLYRFANMTDWDICLIASAGIITNLILALVSYALGFELFARLNIYYALWSLLPLSSLDGSKVLFGSKIVWVILAVISLIFLSFAILAV